MKFLVLFALIGASNAAVQTDGCITTKNDEKTIETCLCHSTCKLCGYGPKEEKYDLASNPKSSWPDKVDNCITCKDTA